MLESDKDNDGILDFNEFKVSTKIIINIMRKTFFGKSGILSYPTLAHENKLSL